MMMQATVSQLLPSLHNFMAGLIDYAGLFPPAKLPLDRAIDEYARLRHDPDRWMLSRFIIPAQQLEALSALAGHLFEPADPFVFSVLGRGGSDVDDFLERLDGDLLAVANFRRRHPQTVVADVFETRLPAIFTTMHDAARIRKVLEAAGERIAAVGGLMPFYETPFSPDWDSTIQVITTALARRERTGFKLRCGGVEAAAFPSPAQLALALVACRDAGLPLKATAGLHHPIRHFSSSVQTKMHGFLNVFGAGLLAHIYHLSAQETAAILADEDSSHFKFTPHDFSWQRFHVSAEHIAMLRQRALISYGSCSFDEPRADLRAMGLLAQAPQPQKDNAA